MVVRPSLSRSIVCGATGDEEALDAPAETGAGGGAAGRAGSCANAVAAVRQVVKVSHDERRRRCVVAEDFRSTAAAESPISAR